MLFRSPIDRAQGLLERVGATVEFSYEVPSGDDIVGILTYPGCPIGPDVLARTPNLKVVATCSGGIDHLDVAGLAECGVWCCNIRNFCDQEVADHTLALVYACLRGVVMLDGLVRSGSWWPYPQAPRLVRGARLGRGRGLEHDAHLAALALVAHRVTGRRADAGE